jgi:hypothetical protein
MAELTRRDLVMTGGRFRTATKMSARSGPARGRHGGAWARLLLAVVVAAGVIALVGCSSSSKPAYCTDRTNLQNSVKGLTSVATSSGVSGLKSQIGTIQSDATTVVNSAKSDFPSETSAITSSVDALKSSLSALSSSPSVTDIATVAKNAAGVASSVKSFVDASNSECS